MLHTIPFLLIIALLYCRVYVRFMRRCKSELPWQPRYLSDKKLQYISPRVRQHNQCIHSPIRLYHFYYGTDQKHLGQIQYLPNMYLKSRVKTACKIYMEKMTRTCGAPFALKQRIICRDKVCVYSFSRKDLSKYFINVMKDKGQKFMGAQNRNRLEAYQNDNHFTLNL